MQDWFKTANKQNAMLDQIFTLTWARENHMQTFTTSTTTSEVCADVLSAQHYIGNCEGDRKMQNRQLFV